MKTIPIGTIFTMQDKQWRVKTDGNNGWIGVECIDHNRAFTSERVEDVMKYINKSQNENHRRNKD